MKTINSLLCLCWAGAVLGLAFHVLPAQAASGNPPDLMTYQGYLVDENGNPLGQSAPKNYDVVFSIWSDQLSTAAGARLWTEQQTITIDKGYFSVLLGEGAVYSGQARPALSALFTTNNASDRYIEIMVKGIGTGGNDVTIAPRLRLLTSPYAFLARTAVNAQTLVNNTYAQVVNISGSNVGINKTSPTSALDVNGTAAATGLNISGAASVNSLTVAGTTVLNGTTTINGASTFTNDVSVTLNKVVEFGKNVAGKESNAGKIGYQRFSTDALDIIGAGTTGANRKVKVFAEAGMTVTGPVAATAFTGNGTIPIGGIIMWSGTAIPTGWALCNGTTVNGVVTPDLRNRFVVGGGTGSQYAVGATGGADTVTLTVPQIPPHSHTYTYRYQAENGGGTKDNHWNATSAQNTGTTGGGQAHENRPPYYALAYIMRVQ